MKTKGTPLTYEERQEIERLIKKGFSLSHIAIKINRSKNGVVTEVRRQGGREQYNALQAHEQAGKAVVIRKEAHRQRMKGNKVAFGMKQRIENLEMQVEILADAIKGLLKHD